MRTPSKGAVPVAGERELDPKDVLADLFGEELPLDEPERGAEMGIQRLRDAGFEIKQIDYTKRRTSSRAECWRLWRPRLPPGSCSWWSFSLDDPAGSAKRRSRSKKAA